MGTYRRKPLKIEALQYDGTNGNDILEFVGTDIWREVEDYLIFSKDRCKFTVAPGDYIVKDQGHSYPFSTARMEKFEAEHICVDDDSDTGCIYADYDINSSKGTGIVAGDIGMLLAGCVSLIDSMRQNCDDKKQFDEDLRELLSPLIGPPKMKWKAAMTYCISGAAFFIGIIQIAAGNGILRGILDIAISGVLFAMGMLTERAQWRGK